MKEEYSRVEIYHMLEMDLVDYHTDGNHSLDRILGKDILKTGKRRF